MKRLFVFVPAILLILFLLSSFVLKEVIGNKPGRVNTVFKSTDGGQTWQDIGQGLPANLRTDSLRGNSISANDKGLFLMVGNDLYHSTPNATAPFWTKEISSVEHRNMAPAHIYWNVNLKNANRTSVWSPVFDFLQETRLRSTFETAGGAIFIGVDKRFFKTTDDGKTWKQVFDGGLVGHLAESNGVLVSISMGKIIRSTDGGENWAPAISEDSVAFDVKQIRGGFTALTASTATSTRRLSTSYDGGKTWQRVEANLQHKAFIDSVWRTWNDRPHVQASTASIIQVGEDFLGTHPDGILKSSDKGKTWTLLLPSIDGKVFKLFVSGNVIYAIPSKGGC